MSKVLFVNGNVHGHINPTLALTKELIERGEEVYYFSTEEFRQRIENTGAGFIEYGDVLTRFLKNFKPSGNHPFYTLLEFILKMDEVVIPLVLEKVKDKKLDYMIHDSMFGGGNILAKLLKLPAICSCTSFAMERLPLPGHMFEPGFHPQLDSLFADQKRIAGALGADISNLMDIFFKKESLNLVYTSRYFQPTAECFDDSFKFVGPSIGERVEQSDIPFNELEGQNLIYISLGTINNKCIDFYRKCMDAFAGDDVRVVLSVGEKIDIKVFDKIPGNFIVRNYVPQLEVLKRSRAFICHGGLNSVSEALYYGVPVIAIPMANDQPMVTKQLVALGAGVGLRMEEVTAQLLKESVFKLLSEETFKNESKRIGDSFIKAGGYKAAADCIQAFKQQVNII